MLIDRGSLIGAALIHTLCKRGPEYGVRAAVFYGSKREKTVLHENLQEACFVLTEISESCRKPPGDYGRV